MKRKILLILLPVFLLACKTLMPTGNTAPETATPRPTVEATMPAPTGSGTTAVRLNPGDGELVDLLAAEVKKAEELGQLPVVEFDADW
jgi:hypothetical protein